MQNLTNFQLTDFLETFRILAGAISGSHEKITKIYFINFEGGGWKEIFLNPHISANFGSRELKICTPLELHDPHLRSEF